MHTLGSLFDGSGGFPLAGAINGIKPVWASEIEPYPIRVTKARFPNMEHLGSVLDVKGDQITPVDIITFGSPCQDLSVAGKQLGIHNGERSNLFFEAIRIAKEMRNHDRATGRADVDLRPRFLAWENVPGAFSSNQGEDFRSVLEAIGSIAQDGLSIPRPPKGKWQHAGCVVGDGWSIAWRLYDAQYWGVPQRRKRIYLVADLASERAGEILFERESLCGYHAEGRETRQGIAGNAQGGAGGSCGVKCLNPWDCQSKRQYAIDGVYRTLDAGESAGGQAHGICYDITGTSSNSMKSATPDSCFRERTVGRTLDTFVGSPECNQGGTVVVASFKGGQGPKAGSIGYREGAGGGCGAWTISAKQQSLATTFEAASTIGANDFKEPQVVCADFVGRQGAKSGSVGYETNKAPTLRQGITSDVVYSLQGNGIDRALTAGCNGSGWREQACYTLNTIDMHEVCYGIEGDGNTRAHIVKDVSPCMKTIHPNAVVYDCRGNGDGLRVPTLTGDHQNRVTDYSAVTVYDTTQITSPLNYSNPRPGDPCHPLAAQQHPPLCVGNTNRKYIVRRLTPLECCRLQGFPDWWEDGVDGSDSARYKMWGNGIALPCAADVLERIVRACKSPSPPVST